MPTENMANIVNKNWFVDYDDGDIFVVTDIKKIAQQKLGSVCINKVIVIVCNEGQLSIDLNDNRHIVKGHEAVICYPEVVISNFNYCANSKCFVFGFSVHAMENTFYANERIWQTVFDVSQSPVIHLTEDEMSMMYHFAEIARIKIAQLGNPLQKRMMHALLQAILYEFFNIIDRYFTVPIQTDMNSKVQIFRRFIELLGLCNGRMRAVTNFANELCITPKYLSSVVKICSGKTPLEWIHLYTTNVIVQQLRYTDKSIKDISNSLGFPSQAFFGKFVKSRLGMSPKKYRDHFHNE